MTTAVMVVNAAVMREKMMNCRVVKETFSERFWSGLVMTRELIARWCPQKAYRSCSFFRRGYLVPEAFKFLGDFERYVCIAD
jgi:hypothetical protein